MRKTKKVIEKAKPLSIKTLKSQLEQAEIKIYNLTYQLNNEINKTASFPEVITDMRKRAEKAEFALEAMIRTRTSQQAIQDGNKLAILKEVKDLLSRIV